VVRALLEFGIRVVFVTHLFDFADGVRVAHGPQTLFLRAPRERDFRLIAAEPLPTSFGVDLLHRLDRWAECAD
jgi:hypothetical protein